MADIDVVGLGVATLDILSLVDHFPSGEEIQRAEDMILQGGGPVATAIVALARLVSDGPRLVVITDGLRGSWVYPAGRPGFHQPPYPLPQTVDTTGCGDAYHGAFLFALLQHMRPEDAAAFASAAAALNARRLGGRAGLPSRAEVEAFLAERGVNP